LRFDVDGVPGDGAGRFYVEEGVIAVGEGGVRGVGMGIPLRDETFGEAKETLTETVVSRGE